MISIDRILEARIVRVLDHYSARYLDDTSVNQLAEMLVDDTRFTASVKIRYEELMIVENERLKKILNDGQ